MKIVNIGIVGSRSRNTFKDKSIIKNLLLHMIKKYKDTTFHIVSGGASRGADRFAEELADELGLGISIHLPQLYFENGEYNASEYARACYERNTLIANECHILLAEWDGASSGTKDTMNKAEEQNKPVIVL